MKVLKCRMKICAFLCMMAVFACILGGCAKNKETTVNESEQTEIVETEAEQTTVEPEISIEDVVQKSETMVSCTYDGVAHEYMTCFPEQCEGAPLVLMLHGYGNTAESFCETVHFEETALQKGYAVVYVTGAPDPNDATSAFGWNSGIGQEGNRDVDFLVSLANYLQKEHSFDRDRMFAVGFSNGAFMTHRLAMEAGDTFAAVVSVAGMMPEKIWEEAGQDSDIGFFQVTGEKDDVVPKHSDGSAKFAKAPAIEDVMDYWVTSNGLAKCEETEIGKGSVLTKYAKEGSKKQVWNLFVKDGRHSWPDESISGINVNELIVEFLETQG